MNNIVKSKLDEFLKLHAEISNLMVAGLDRALRAGKLLAEIKESLKHGQWLPWLKENVPVDERTVQRYMLVHRHRDRIKNDKMTDLFSALKLIQNLKEFDKVAKDYGLSSHTKAKIRKTITPDIDNIEFHVNFALPFKKKEKREQSAEDLRYKRTIDSQLNYARQAINRATGCIETVYFTLKEINAEIVDRPTGGFFDQFEFYLPVKLHAAVKNFNKEYDKLYRSYSNSVDEEQPKKPVESVEVQFPRKELPMPATKIG